VIDLAVAGASSPSMPRVARIVLPGVLHDITQRGNNRQDVFFVDDDRGAYLAILANQTEMGTEMGTCYFPTGASLAPACRQVLPSLRLGGRA
jgi:hypothetical protein